MLVCFEETSKGCGDGDMASCQSKSHMQAIAGWDTGSMEVLTRERGVGDAPTAWGGILLLLIAEAQLAGCQVWQEHGGSSAACAAGAEGQVLVHGREVLAWESVSILL